MSNQVQNTTQYYNTNYTKVFYKFEKLSAEKALEDIRVLTKDYSAELGLTPEFVETLKTNINARGYSFQGFLYAPKEADVTRQVIGKGGCYFHKTTADCQIDFIWHNRESGQFLFWGEKANLIHAMDIIRTRITNKNDEFYAKKREQQYQFQRQRYNEPRENTYNRPRYNRNNDSRQNGIQFQGNNTTPARELNSYNYVHASNFEKPQ
jgi:hypothetical protein